MQLIATCAFGLEKLINNELKNLGLNSIQTEDGRITFEGDETAMIKANLWLRCADRIQIKMAGFKALTFDELFDHVNALPWEDFIAVNDAFPVSATSVKSALHATPAIQSIVKKAVVKRLQSAHKTETLPENSTAVHQIVVKVNKDEFVICIDSSGDSLHKRGYRGKANAAPIKETLAAALVMLSDWTPERTLIDPFCGSATIAIEAAMIAQNVAPGLKRNFAFENWSWTDPAKLDEAKLEALTAMKPHQKFSIYNFDIDPEVLVIAEENATRAGIEHMNFKRSDFNELDFTQFENCTFIANPPYGERLELQERVVEMYRKLGQKFAQSKDCSLFLITSYEGFEKVFGRKADKNRKLFNGGLKCYLFSFLKPSSK